MLPLVVEAQWRDRRPQVPVSRVTPSGHVGRMSGSALPSHGWGGDTPLTSAIAGNLRSFPRISMPAGTSIVDISHLRLLVHQRPVASASEEIVRSHCDDLDALREALREHFAPSVDTARWETISIPSPSAVPRPACVPGSMATPGTPISSTLAGSTPRTAAYQPSTDSRSLTTSTGRTSWMRDVSRSPTP